MANEQQVKRGGRIAVCKLPFGERTENGAYWAKVDGHNIGVNGRTHWESAAAARLAAEVYIETAEQKP